VSVAAAPCTITDDHQEITTMRRQIDTAKRPGATCFWCHGKGGGTHFLGDWDCRNCNGTGRITDRAELIRTACLVRHSIETEGSRPGLEPEVARGEAFLEEARAIVPSRFRIRRDKGWRKPPGGRYVNRSGRFGNPFRVDWERRVSPFKAVALFREWITAPGRADLLADARRELRGRDLGCNCSLRDPCHADVLLELVND
jgi:hypothetical protein